MTIRQISISNKKLRGIPRRLRALSNWEKSFHGYFPDGLKKQDKYWNYKIPVHESLVQGRQAKRQLQAQCAQNLINAAHHIFLAKPSTATDFRVTCTIALPDMFISELCIFLNEDYFSLYTSTGKNYLGEIEIIQGRSLTKEWNLSIPEGFFELGVLRTNIDDDGNPYVSEYWYIGEVNNL
ncbi:DUF3916 domain-containing protein [Chromobacterium violaceum]|uniref:DUF3916 domain-containing protein n=1 Tax=Chromobacterium violaceum TaxID=536 RepID=UPI0009BA5F46|nr:DUF3916 domain-containing protein [Chromobacterium violaceum]